VRRAEEWQIDFASGCDGGPSQREARKFRRDNDHTLQAMRDEMQRAKTRLN